MKNFLNYEPYKLFFPFGLFYAIFGSVLWIFFQHDIIKEYPGFYHPDIMITGFLFTFIIGFFMTAFPRFTQTDAASKTEKISIFSIIFIQAISCLFFKSQVYRIISLFSLLFLFQFAIRRFLKKKVILFPNMIFVAHGFILGTIGLVSLIIAPNGFFGKVLLYKGLILCFILGIGTQLIPALSGYGPVALMGSMQKQKRTRLIFFILSLCLSILLILEGIFHTILISFTFPLIVGYIFFNFLKIYKIPPVKTKLVRFIWLACWMTLIGLILENIFPAHRIHLEHLTYIGGFGLMTLMISTRILLSHGGHDLSFEKNSNIYWWIAGLVIISTLTRVSVIFFNDNYSTHLSYASFCWIIAVFIWSYFIFKKKK